MKMRLLPVLLSVLLLAGCTRTASDAGNSALLKANSGGEPASGTPAETGEYSIDIFAMDTVMELTAYNGASQEAAEQAVMQAVERIYQLDSLLSTTNEDSEIHAANHSGGEPVPLSGGAAQLLEQALALCEDTGGALDVSIYPVVRTWGFTTGEYQVPDEDALAALLEQVDYSRIVLEDGVLTVPDGMEIDLGAVAKGYTGDQVLELFRQAGITSAIVNLGGNLQVLGAKPDGSPWRLAVQDPTGDGYACVLEVVDKALITSGGYERYFEQDGVRYWHIIDPATGSPARNGLISVTIVADSGTLGDALSTALFVMGKEQAVEYWRSRDDFDFVLISEDGTVTISEGIEDALSLFGVWADHTLEVARR